MSDIFANLGVATHAKTESRDPQATGHYLRQFGVTGPDTAAVHPNRHEAHRGNTYINPLSLVGPDQARRGIIQAWDCKNATGATNNGEGDRPDNSNSPACFSQTQYEFQGRLHKFPHVESEDYSNGG